MNSAVRHPLRIPLETRRKLLSRHFVSVVESLVQAGESYNSLSVERLIRAAGISRSTFYSYFEDKGDLLSAMAEDVLGELFAAGQAWWDLPADASRDDLRNALRAPLEAWLRHQTLFGSLVELAAYDARVRVQHQRLVEEPVAALAAHIKHHQLNGSAAPELDADRTASWLLWMLEQGTYQMIPGASTAEVDRLLEALTDLIWRALYAGYRT